MFLTYSYTIIIIFALLQIIYILLFYRLEKRQKEEDKSRVLHSTKGIYFSLFTAILGIPIITNIISMITGSLFFSNVETGFYIYGIVVGTMIFLLLNSIIKDYNGLCFYNNYFTNVEYNVLLRIINKERIHIENINTVCILYCARGVLLHLKFNDDKEDYFNIQYLNYHHLESYFLHRNLKATIFKIKISEFKKLSKKWL